MFCSLNAIPLWCCHVSRYDARLQSSAVHTKAIQKVFSSPRLPQEQARLLTVGSIETREPTCRNTARGDLGHGASVVFGLWTWLLRCPFAPRKNKGQRIVFMGGGCERGWNIQAFMCFVWPQRNVHEWTEMFKNGQTSVADAASTSASDDK
jgi:hypothetical protein